MTGDRSGYVDLLPIRNLYLVSNTLGTHNTTSVNGEWGILKRIHVHDCYNEMVYDQTVWGMGCLKLKQKHSPASTSRSRQKEDVIKEIVASTDNSPPMLEAAYTTTYNAHSGSLAYNPE